MLNDSDNRFPSAFQTSLPVFLSSATTARPSLAAFTITRFLNSTGLADDPQPRTSDWVPRLACQSFFPSRSKAATPVLPKNA